MSLSIVVFSMKNDLKIAIIAEDSTDCEAVKEIVHRVRDNKTTTKPWDPRGCSHLRRKLERQLNLLYQQGCNAFILIHDLDRNPANGSLNDEEKLRKDLEKLVAKSKLPANQPYIICIPIEELEAWFWSDPKVIAYVGQGKGKPKTNPHLVCKPKEELIKLSIDEKRKPRYSTNMNADLAKILDLELCSDRCPSFKQLVNFLESL